ncbi:XRE family transcriptional regulator [Curtobacterium sp. MCSS17_005]|uniref:XRE family transcriptional regulator n=1 Tax=Curtobacterium sp. MCSS17_005 TaxID=2175641 RepID=UPI000DA93153|nr:XRE family transcriptional regulator [Curtobacterium sp. MCSS17_005]WIB33929.1 XRE family transcriptional regulator [Curtobacterium sp. MCSS17_005]
MNPQMLTLLRESRGYSGAQLAKLAGIPQPTLSKAENGLATLDDARLQKVADVLDYPVDAFSWTDPVYGFGSAAFYHRKQQSLPQTVLRKIQAQVNLTRMRLDKLLRSIEIDTQYSLPVLAIEDFGSPAEVARGVRANWRMPMGPVRDMAATLELAGIIVVRSNLESPKIAAISLDNVGTYPALIILNAGMSADRERFTLAHELGHLVMHSVLVTSDEAEREADEFAAEFLMPAAEIRTQLKGMTLARAAQLKVVWRVAMSALIRRARDLGLIDATRYKSLIVSMSQKGWRKAEPVEVQPDHPTVVSSLIDVHLRDHGYSFHELAQVVALNPSEFGSRFEVEAPESRKSSGGHLRALK